VIPIRDQAGTDPGRGAHPGGQPPLFFCTDAGAVGGRLLGLATGDVRRALCVIWRHRPRGTNGIPTRSWRRFEKNEPWLSSAWQRLGAIVQLAVDAGLSRERIFVCASPRAPAYRASLWPEILPRYGGLIAFTGGLIGPPDADLHHEGDLGEMPAAVLVSGDPDPHVPWSRVLESAEQFTAMGAAVKTQRFPGRPHTVPASGNQICARAYLQESSLTKILRESLCPGITARLKVGP